jgi:hypothetical protein
MVIAKDALLTTEHCKRLDIGTRFVMSRSTMPMTMRMILLGVVLLVACDGDSRSSVDAPGPGDAAAPGDDAGGSLCGGFANFKCLENEYCDFADNNCGVADGPGRCRRRPDACPLSAGGPAALVAEPVCACDGRVYSSECIASASGQDLNAHGSCELPQSRFACGYAQCNLATQYCVHEPMADGADRYRCLGMPACALADASCQCLAGEPCGNACTGDAAVGLTLTCP